MEILVYAFLSYGKLEKNYSIYTLKGYKSDLLAFVRWLDTQGVTEPVAITRGHIQRYDAMHADKKPMTRRRKIAAIRAFALWLLDEQHYIQTNPAKKIKLPPESPEERRIPTDVEKDALFTAANRLSTPYLSALATMMLALMFNAGLRPMETIAVDLEDVNLEKRLLVVKCGKGRKRREIPINNTLVQHIRAWLPVRLSGSDSLRLLVTPQRRPMTYHLLRVTVIRIKVIAGLRAETDLTAHCFRHWFASSLYQAGADVDVIRKLLGHDSLTTTQCYLHQLSSALHDAVNLLDVPAKRPAANPLTIVADDAAAPRPRVKPFRLLKRMG